MYPVNIQGNTFEDQWNGAYLQALSPEIFYQLWARRGVFGIPMHGSPITADEAFGVANLLAAQGFKVTRADLTGIAPYESMLSYVTEGYKVASYVGEPNPDWMTAPPGQDLPNTPPYDSTGHTCPVGFLPLPEPFAGPVPEQIKYVGTRANADGMYNAINGAEKVFAVGQENTQDGVKYVFLGPIGNNPPVIYWQYVGRA